MDTKETMETNGTLSTNKNNFIIKYDRGNLQRDLRIPFFIKTVQMRIFSFYILMIILSLPLSCKKDYERPDHYSLDLFRNERNEQQKRILTAEEANEKSLLVIKSDKTELVSTPKINNKLVYIYKIKDGKITKKTSDSLSFPIRIISDYDLKISKGKTDSTTIYLMAPRSYKLLITEFDVSFQALPAAPTL
ncbi:hypothetical protein SAMN04488097_3688 [Epilithonimonas lactis]|nr:hypothetical protein SAMN04488097_3688 [Epilithonimonas lactis]